MAEIERRAAVELRSTGRQLFGYAAVFGIETRIGTFVESVAPGAFARSLSSGRDVLLLGDHDRTRVLARTAARTLRLSEDGKGLRFETDDLPATSYANDVLALVGSGNAGGASFAFTVPKGGERWSGERRTLTDVDLHECSIVSGWPGYSETEVFARCRPPIRLCLAQKYLETC